MFTTSRLRTVNDLVLRYALTCMGLKNKPNDEYYQDVLDDLLEREGWRLSKPRFRDLAKVLLAHVFASHKSQKAELEIAYRRYGV